MKELASRRTRFQADAVGAVGVATVPARRLTSAGVGQTSPVGLAMAQATLAALLALAVAFLTPLGFAEGFILATAGLVLVASGVLLVVWSDRDDVVRTAQWRAETDDRSAA
jgi:high-affinity Fe2+/Pb2+ permease